MIQRLKFHQIVIVIFFGSAFFSANLFARTVFLNGTDISSAKSQDLKNVSIHIDEKGDLYISAPHYQVNEENTFLPLSKYVQSLNRPSHKGLEEVPKAGFETDQGVKVPSLSEQSISPEAQSGQAPNVSVAAPKAQETTSAVPEKSASPASKEGLKSAQGSTSVPAGKAGSKTNPE